MIFDLQVEQSIAPYEESSVKGTLPKLERFACGQKALQFARADHQQLRRHAALLPGAAEIDADYLSITWDEMLQAIGAPRRRSFEPSQVDKALMANLNARQGIGAELPTGIVLTRRGTQICARTRHIDALGLLLMQRRTRSTPSFSSREVFAIRQWLGTARLMFAFRVNLNLFMQAFMQTYPELGPLAGDGGVPMITNKVALRRAWRHFEEVFLDFPNLEVLWHSPFAPKRTDIFVVSELDESPPSWIDMSPSLRA